jgi:P27 family predicted phage terminase small subunit
MSGPPKRPLELVRLEGNPGKRRLPKPENDVKDTSGIPDCPTWLDAAARAEWTRVVPLLDAMGLVGKVDRAALTGYCVAYSRFTQAEQILGRRGLTMEMVTKGGGLYEMQRPEVTIAQKYLAIVKAFCAEYGMTASARARMSIDGDKEKDDFSDLDREKVE